MSLLTIGTVAFDEIETPFGKTDKILGGAATYIGLSASNFVNNVNIVSVVGEDFPEEYVKIIESHGVDTRGLQIKKGEKREIWTSNASAQFFFLQNVELGRRYQKKSKEFNAKNTEKRAPIFRASKYATSGRSCIGI